MANEQSPLRLIIADANASFADLIESALDGEFGMTLVGRAVDGEEAVQLVFLHSPDVVFIAADMPSAAEAVQHILSLAPRPPKIILMCGEELDATALQASAGVSGYVRKKDDVIDMVSLLAALAALSMAHGSPRANGDHVR